MCEYYCKKLQIVTKVQVNKAYCNVLNINM